MKHFRPAAIRFLLACGLTGLGGCAPSVKADLSHVQMVQAPGCTIPRIGEIALAKAGPLRSVPAKIDGHPVSLLLDTGASDVVITAATAKQLDLPESQEVIVISWGLGGFAKAKPVWTHDFEIAGFDLQRQRVGLAGFGPEGQEEPVGGLLGSAYLSAFDVDIDFAHDRMTLYGSRHCAQGFVPWSVPFDAVPMKLDSTGQIQVAVKIDGHPMTAMLDTGSALTVLTPSGAARLGLSAAVLDKAPSARIDTSDGHGTIVRARRFDRLEIGHQSWQQPVLAVQSPDDIKPDPVQAAIRAQLALKKALDAEPEVILGVDFLAQYEIWIAYGDNQVFLAPITPPKG